MPEKGDRGAAIKAREITLLKNSIEESFVFLLRDPLPQAPKQMAQGTERGQRSDVCQCPFYVHDPLNLFKDSELSSLHS